jgi:hypothetical protein
MLRRATWKNISARLCDGALELQPNFVQAMVRQGGYK